MSLMSVGWTRGRHLPTWAPGLPGWRPGASQPDGRMRVLGLPLPSPTNWCDRRPGSGDGGLESGGRQARPFCRIPGRVLPAPPASGPPADPWRAAALPPSSHVPLVDLTSASSSSKVTSHRIWGPPCTRMTSLYSDCTCKDPISQYGHRHRYGGVRTSTFLHRCVEGGHTAPPLTRGRPQGVLAGS